MENDRWMLRADGSRFWADGVMYPLRTGDGALLGFSKMLRDRTDLMQQMQSMRNEIAALGERSAQKDRVLAVAAHELRNPLFALTVGLDTVRRGLQDTGRYQEAFDAIDRQIQSIRRLLDDITDATQVRAGKLKLRHERVDLREVINRALETLRPAIQMRRHSVTEVLLPVTIPVDGDPDRLQQVVQNLIDNAVKYTPPGGTIGLEATIEANEAVFKIEDNGIGVAPDMQTQIFDLFTQAHDPGEVNEKGLGIGLALVKNLVLQHGGTVQVRSNGAGKGSEFTIRLTLARSGETTS
jgi:two-component system CheB/CheR fusion protein